MLVFRRWPAASRRSGHHTHLGHPATLATSASLALALALALATALASCSSSDSVDEGQSAVTPIESPRLDAVFENATGEQLAAFNDGDALFDTPFYPADGLGPLYVDVSCGDCHNKGLRGAGFDSRMVMVEADGVTTAADQSPIAFGNEIRNRMTAGAKTPVVPPDMPNVKVTARTPPAVVGRGYMEAVLDSEIERVEAEQAKRTDAIHGKANRVVYLSEATGDVRFNPSVKGQNVIGRFGLKARVATLDEFVADAMQNDMGITSPLRPTEVANPDGLIDDEKPGVDTTLEVINKMATYMRELAIPTRAVATEGGQALFDQAKCSVCHVPSLKTRADYPIPQLAGIDAPVFTDFLLHDMGDALADGMPDGSATSRQYRTSPLIGVRYLKVYLNDGRAKTVEEAIVQHAGEAEGSARAFQALSTADRAALVEYVNGL